jgi:hypothetical protein
LRGGEAGGSAANSSSSRITDTHRLDNHSIALLQVADCYPQQQASSRHCQTRLTHITKDSAGLGCISNTCCVYVERLF